MPKFKDLKDREWSIDVNVAIIKKVRALIEVDLLAVLDKELLEKMRKDPIFLVAVLWAVCTCNPNNTHSVTEEDFGAAMAGDVIDNATQALLDAIISFYPSRRDRDNLGAILAATNKAVAKAQDLTEQKIKDLDVDKLVEEAMQRNSGTSPTPAPAS